MKTKTQHPFMTAEVEVPKEKEKDIAAVRSWLAHQPHLPALTDEHILMFLHSNYFSLERTKDTIDSYYIIRAENPDLFTNWDYKHLEQQFKMMEMAALPETTPEKYKILLYRLKELDASKLNMHECVKAFLAFNDFRISEDGLTEGYIVVFDMKGCTLSHLARVSTVMNLLRIFMIYIQECHPVRLKAVHVINTVSWIDKGLGLIKPFLQSGLIQLLHFHNNVDGLAKYFPLSIMPEDYGGQVKSTESLHEESQNLLKKMYSNWLVETTKFQADLKKQPAKNKTFSTMQGSFRTLSID